MNACRLSMRTNRQWTLVLLFSLLLNLVPYSPIKADESDVPRMLFLTQSKGFVHNPVKRRDAERSSAELAMMQLAKDSGEFTVVCTQNAAADFTAENLENFDIIAFYTSGDLPIDESDFDYFLNKWLPRKGKGVLGFHSAADTLKNFEPYWDLMGGSFNGHPWTANTTVTMKIHDADHPAVKPFGDSYFTITDEIYQYKNWQPEKVRVLLSLDMKKTELKRPYHVPVAWCKQVGEGKLFFNNMGHRDETWKNLAFLDSITGAVRWIRGLEEGEAEPNPQESARQHLDSIKFSEAAGITEETLAAEAKAKAAAQKAKRAAQNKRAAEKKAKKRDQDDQQAFSTKQRSQDLSSSETVGARQS
ncbi:MAG: ThuA domain-containing protein [Aureliella sp.]